MFTRNTSLSTDLSTSRPQERRVFVIFVHFGASEITNAAIDSLRSGTTTPNHTIIVDHADTVFTSRSSVHIVRESNRGYAAGLMTGIAYAESLGVQDTDLLVLANNDLQFAQDDLRHIRIWWDVNGGSRVLGGVLGGYVSLFTGRAYVSSELKKNFWTIPYIHGSCMVGEYKLFSSIPFMKSFFMYWEDVAISIDVQRNGGTLTGIPGLHITHNDTESHVSLTKLFYLVRNGAYVLEKYPALPWRLYWYGVNTLRIMYHFSCRGVRHLTVARALRDARTL